MVWILLFLVTVPCLSIRVTTPRGQLEGQYEPVPDYNEDIAVFRGIRYADPPARFKKSKIVTPWDGVKDAKSKQASCIQQVPEVAKKMNLPFPNQPESEDCLFLSIYTPANLTAQSPDQKSVMVFIHGGSFTSGSANDYEGHLLAAHGDVVVVLINYRLGTLGFLRTNGEKDTANLGLWDQRLALQWVKENIAAFGGDPNEVTIFGESAGSWSVSYQMITPHNDRTLFQRGIMESGALFSITPDSFNLAKALAEEFGCKSGTTDEAIQCLETKKWEEIRDMTLKWQKKFAPGGPHFDNGEGFFSEDPLDTLTKFESKGPSAIEKAMPSLDQYDSLSGYNTQDGLFLMNFNPKTATATSLSPDAFRDFITEMVSLPQSNNNPNAAKLMTELVVSRYTADKVPGNRYTRGNPDENRLIKAVEILGYAESVIFGSIKFAQLHAEVALNKNTFLYEFDHKPAGRTALDSGPEWLKYSANHADEIRFVFGVLVNGSTEAEKQLSRTVMTYWTNFAKFGNPQTEDIKARGGVAWPKVTSQKPFNLLRMTLDKDVIQSAENGGLVEFWTTLNVAGRRASKRYTAPQCSTQAPSDEFGK